MIKVKKKGEIEENKRQSMKETGNNYREKRKRRNKRWENGREKD